MFAGVGGAVVTIVVCGGFGFAANRLAGGRASRPLQPTLPASNAAAAKRLSTQEFFLDGRDAGAS